jgi:PiT family inorganic phosphate transporter
MLTFFLMIIVILLILIFAYFNGLHDISNIIATMISSGSMKARQALLLALIWEIIGPLIGGTMVARAVLSLVHFHEIQSGMGSQALLLVVGSGVLSAIIWSFATWYWGIPSSSSHALCGGLIGAALVSAGRLSIIDWGFRGFDLLSLRGFAGIAAALFISPFLGFIAGFLVCKFMRFLLLWATPKANEKLKRAQWLTASGLAFAHGTNAAQKSMGLLALVLVSGGAIPDFRIGFGIRIICGMAVSLGAIFGGWRIMKTVGEGIFRLRPEHGFDTQLASSMIILGNTFIGGPVSSTHVVSSTIMGVGTAVRQKAVRWQKVFEIILAWFITLPITIILGGVIYMIFSLMLDVG